MTQNLRDLKDKCRELGLSVTQSGLREAKEDYIAVLRAHFLFHDYPNGCPYSELRPMLCFPYRDLYPNEQESIWRDNNGWIAQQKFNGVRLILHFIKGVGVFAHSRAVSVKTYRMQSLEDHLLFSGLVPDFSAVVDTEAIADKMVDTRQYVSSGKSQVTKSSLQSTMAVLHLEAGASKRLQREQDAALTFQVFDIVNWNGSDLKGKKLCERLGYLADFRTAITATPAGNWFQFPPVRFDHKKAFYDQVVNEGGEGIIFKCLNFTYHDSLRRSRSGWIKLKKERQFDAYVSGFGPGTLNGRYKNLIGYLTFSVKTETGPHEIARISNLPKAFRKRISIIDPSTRTLALEPTVYGKTACLVGQEVSQRVYRLSHPKIVRWYRLGVENPCHYPLTSIRGDNSRLSKGPTHHEHS